MTNAEWKMVKTAAAFTAILLAVVGVLYTASRGRTEDSTTHCPLQTAVEAKSTVIIYDQSDKLTGPSANLPKEKIREIATKLDKGERLSLFVLNEATLNNLAPIFDECSPGPISSPDIIIGGGLKVEEEKRKTFLTRLEQSMTRADQASPSKESPLIRSLALISRDSRYFPRNTRLVLISDLLENSDIWNLYEPTNTWDAFKSSPRARSLDQIQLGQRLGNSRRRTAVSICPLTTEGIPNNLDMNNVYIFWMELFREVGACWVDRNCIFQENECRP
jgi:hypothetical protein